MKIIFDKTAATPRKRGSERGFMVIALLAILALMMVYVMASARILASLKTEIKMVEKKQIRRLSPPPLATTNTGSSVVPKPPANP